MNIENLIKDYNIIEINSYYINGGEFYVPVKVNKNVAINLMFSYLRDLGFDEFEGSFNEDDYEFIEGGNTYNFDIPIPRDINYELYKSKDGSYLIVCNVHVGDDIRAGYSQEFYKIVDGKDDFYEFLSELCSFYCRLELTFKDKSDLILEFDNSGYILFDNINKKGKDISLADEFYDFLNNLKFDDLYRALFELFYH